MPLLFINIEYKINNNKIDRGRILPKANEPIGITTAVELKTPNFAH